MVDMPAILPFCLCPRPLDMLVRMLEERHRDCVRQFVEAYGAPEAAAMCIAIASSRPGTYPAVGMHTCTCPWTSVFRRCFVWL